MKTIFLLLLTTMAFGQQHRNFRLNTVDHFNYYLTSDPVASIDDGLNIGIGIEYVGPIYAGLSFRTMPVLEDGYNEFVGNIGLPFVSGYNGDWEYRIGISLGWVKRIEIAPVAMGEIKLSKSFFDNSFYIFAGCGYQWREDFKLYAADAKWQKKCDVGIGKRF